MIGAVEAYKAVAVINGESKEIQDRQAEESGNLGSEAAALIPHIKCGYPQIFLAEAREFEKYISGLIDVGDLATDPVDSGPIVAADMTRLFGHFVRN